MASDDNTSKATMNQEVRVAVEMGKKFMVAGRRLDAEEQLLKAMQLIGDISSANDMKQDIVGSLAALYERMSDWPQAVHYQVERMQIVNDMYGVNSSATGRERYRLAFYQWKLLDSVEESSQVLTICRATLVTHSQVIKHLEQFCGSVFYEFDALPPPPLDAEVTTAETFDAKVQVLKQRLVYCLALEHNLRSVNCPVASDGEANVQAPLPIESTSAAERFDQAE